MDSPNSLSLHHWNKSVELILTLNIAPRIELMIEPGVGKKIVFHLGLRTKVYQN